MMIKKVFALGLVGSVLMIALLAAGHLAQAGPAAGAPDTMLAANRLYENGQFEQAAQAYRQLAAQGFADSVLFYNLGNAWFKQGDVGRAILNYRRAARLAPRDPDIRANLDLARAQTVDQLDPAHSEAFFSHLLRLSEQWLTLDEMAALALGLWVLFAVVLIAAARSHPGSNQREGLQYALIVIAVLLAGTSIALGSRIYLEQTRPEAVIVAAEVDVTSGPGKQYVTEFTLHSGAEVSLLEQRSNWTRLALPGGETQGWVPATAIEPVAGF